VLQKVPRYRDRQQAGGVLGELLVKYAGQNVAVFGVGPGGVVVAAPVAAALGADLDVLMIRPLTMPGRPDRAWGALSASDERVYVVAEQDAEAAAIASADVPGSASRRELTALRHLRDTMRSGRLPERSVDGWSSWWVTAWPALRRCGPRHPLSEGTSPPGWSTPFPLPPAKRAENWRKTRTSWCVPGLWGRSGPSLRSTV